MSNEASSYTSLYYQPNPALAPALPGNPDISDPNRWQPLLLETFIDQSGRPVPGGARSFLGPEWGNVIPFSLTGDDLKIYQRGGFEYRVYHDPGPPPYLGGEGDQQYKVGFARVVIWSGLLDPQDSEMIDISPGARGNNPLGTQRWPWLAGEPGDRGALRAEHRPGWRLLPRVGRVLGRWPPI
jgi:hypothetical protein